MDGIGLHRGQRRGLAPGAPARLRLLRSGALLAAAAWLLPPATDPELAELVAGITGEECYQHVQVLAGPAAMGRDTGSPGLDHAAAYVEEHLKAYGLEPAGQDGSYRWTYEQTFMTGEGSRMLLTGVEEAPAWEAGRDFLPFPGSKPGAAAGEPLFVGYAIKARNERWSDMPPAKVKGKVVFAFTREPRADDPRNKRFEGLEYSRHSSVARKAQEAEQAGAVALVLVPDPLGFPQVAGPLPGLVPAWVPPGMDPERWATRSGMPDIPVLCASRAAAEALFGEDLEDFQRAIDKRFKPRHLKGPKKAALVVEVKWNKVKLPAFNLAARLPGTGDGAEVVVIGAHLDHVGWALGADNALLRVHPGADDNASGSAALLEVAEALAGTRPEADVLFLWFSGEERGLLGSRAYCRDPLYPLERTVVMLNLDMVGRGEPRKANIGGLWDRPGWRKLVLAQWKRIDSELKLDLEQGRDLYARSDQFAFHSSGVAGLYFFEADLQDNPTYHTPSDLPETIDGEKMARIAKLVAATAYAVAGEGLRP